MTFTEEGFNAARLRRVAKLVGLENALPNTDATVVACAGTVLGMIAREVEKLRDESASLQSVVTNSAQYQKGYDDGRRHAAKEMEECNDYPGVLTCGLTLRQWVANKVRPVQPAPKPCDLCRNSDTCYAGHPGCGAHEPKE